MPKKACGNPCCGVSSCFTEQFTFGSGKLDDNGFWEHPCRLCAEQFDRENPGFVKVYGPSIPTVHEENNLVYELGGEG